MRSFAIRIAVSIGLLAIPATGQTAGQPADLARFGHLRTWDPNGDFSPVSRTAPSKKANVGVEWDETRELTEIRASFKSPISPAAVHPEYWVSLASANPPGGGQGGWTLTDSPWKGTWEPVHGTARLDNGVWVFHIEAAKPWRTLKLRLRFDSTPVLTSLEVFGRSRWNTRDIRIETGCEGKPAQSIDTEPYNGRVVNSQTEGKVTHLRVLYLEHLPDSNDRTVLTLHTPNASFGLAVEDIIRNKSIYVRDLGIFAADEAAGTTFAIYMSSGRLHPGTDIISRVSKQPEQSLERAMSDIPPLTMRDRSGRHANRYIPVGVFADREKYAVEFNGNLFINKKSSKVFADEQAHMEWSGDELSYRIGTGSLPDFRERERASIQSVAAGYLPIILTDWSNDGLKFHEETFATLLDAPLETANIRGDEPSVLLARLMVKNPSSAAKPANVWLHLTPTETLSLNNGLLTASGDHDGAYAQLRVRAAIKTDSGTLQIATLPVESEYQGSAVQWTRNLAPTESAILNLAITFRTVHNDANIQRLTHLDYDRERDKVERYWATLIDSGARLHVPDETLNSFYRGVLQHILLSVQRDVPTGLYMAPCGTYDYNMFANETDIQVRLMDMGGLPDFAAKFVEPFFALQGSKPFPGRFRETSAILHGVRVDPEHDYTHSGYNMNHGWTLWTGAEHYLFTRDKAWLQAHREKMIKAANWIVSERKSTMRTDENGKKVWEYGLLPPGQLEDNEEWQYWFAVNAYAYRGLKTASLAISDIDPSEGGRLADEASNYRQDIRSAAFRSMAASPAVPLADGTWVPSLATRTHTHGRDIGWIRNILYGPQVLVDCGILSPDEPATGWILRDLEDNLFMSPESFSVSEQDWFSRGGITLQPNLVNAVTIYLARDEVPQALRAFYNAFAVSYYPDVNMFSEWEPSFGRSGGPFFKTSDEAASLAFLRQLLVREQDDTLYLASGAPRHWFRPGQRIEFTGAPTYFGQVSLAIESHPEAGHIDATITVPPGFRGKEIKLSLRQPQAQRIARVEMDGRPWTSIDAAHERISIPTTPGTKTVRAFY